jgi:CTP:molybdopterin cytidylyltransferase MocA
MTFASIILAAGEGSRLGRCKASLPFGFNGETLLSHLISVYLNSKVDNIFVITGYWKDETVTAAQNFSSIVKFINNDNPRMGMFSSVCKGVSLLENDVKHFFVHPVDIPSVKEETILKMKNAIFNTESNKTWVVPECKNEEGHPVLISSLLIPELLNWNGEYGLQGFLSLHKNNKKTEYVDDEGTIFDIDNQEDFLKLTRGLML